MLLAKSRFNQQSGGSNFTDFSDNPLKQEIPPSLTLSEPEILSERIFDFCN